MNKWVSNIYIITLEKHQSSGGGSSTRDAHNSGAVVKNRSGVARGGGGNSRSGVRRLSRSSAGSLGGDGLRTTRGGHVVDDVGTLVGSTAAHVNGVSSVHCSGLANVARDSDGLHLGEGVDALLVAVDDRDSVVRGGSGSITNSGQGSASGLVTGGDGRSDGLGSGSGKSRSTRGSSGGAAGGIKGEGAGGEKSEELHGCYLKDWMYWDYALGKW